MALIGIGFLLLMLFTLRNIFVLSFYEGYFRQKQLNLGNDPEEEIRRQFPFLWWLFL